MIRVTCDTCEKPIDRATDRWYGLDMAEPFEQSVDPVEAMNDQEAELVTALRVGFGSDHEHHFCSASCLSSWAFGQELEGETS